jgi:streptomycin 6-kinase
MTLPDEVRASVLRFFGDDGRAWIDALPGIVADLAERWGLTLGAAYGGGSHALVLAVARRDGTPAVLKVPALDDENRAEAAALRRYAGDGAALLYESDPDTGALLMERLEPGTPLRDHPDRDEALDVACALLRRLSRPVPSPHPFLDVPDVVRGWADELAAAEARGRRALAAPERDEYVSTLHALAVPEGPDRLANRDANLGNVLAARREPWLLIDPKPLVGEPAFDGGWLLVDLLRGAPNRADARRLADRIGAGLGVPADRVRAWAFARSAQHGYWEVSTDGDPSVYQALTAALSARGTAAPGGAPGRPGRRRDHGDPPACAL